MLAAVGGLEGPIRVSSAKITARAKTARDAVKALIVANEFLEARVEQLKADVSSGYARGCNHGRFKTCTG